MNVKTELIALAVRALSEKTDLISKPDNFTEFFATFTTGKTYDERVAEQIEEFAQKSVTAARKMRTDRKFKKITQNV